MISAVTTHKIEISDLMYLSAPFAKGFSSNDTSKILELDVMHSLLVAYLDPVVLTNVRKLRLPKLTVLKAFPKLP